MKIPTYTNRAEASNDAPGRSFASRMNATPFIQAALAEGKVVGALSAEVGEYALQRQKMIANAEYNNNALALEESIREATFDLSKSSDLGNIFQGGNLWQKRMDRIRKDVLGNIQNSNVQKKLDFSFNQSEIQSRFQLQTVVDKKIIAAEQAAIGARQAQAVTDLSQIGASIEAYNAAMGQVAESQSGGVKDGRFSPTVVSTSNLKMRKDIASNYLANAYGLDVMKSYELVSLLDLQDEVAAGTLTTEQAMGQASVVDGYAAHILLSLPRAEALGVIDKNLDMAIQFFDRQDKIIAQQDKDIKLRNDQAYGLAFTSSDTISMQQLAKVLPRIVLENLELDGKLPQKLQDGYYVAETIDAKKAIFNYLDSQLYFTDRAKRSAIEAQLSGGTQIYAESTNDEVYNSLFVRAEAGQLTYENLNEIDTFSQITAEDYRTLITKISTQSDKNLVFQSGIVKRDFRYTTESNDADPELGQAAKAAYFAVDGALRDYFFEQNKILIKPLTASQIDEKRRELTAQQNDIFVQMIRDEYQNYLLKKARQIAGIGTIDPADPIGSIDAAISAGVSAADRSALIRIKSTINSYYADRGLF